MNQLLNLLEMASLEHRQALRKIIDSTPCASAEPEDIIKGLRWLNRTLFEDFRRDVFGDPESYHCILREICKRQKIKSGESSEMELEESIVRHVLEAIWDKLTPEQRSQMNSVMLEISKQTGANTSLKEIASIPTLLAAGNLGGFGVYVAASTTLAAIGSAVGVTFPFIAYTSLSSAISVALGPVGWIAGGLYVINKLSGPNDKKLVPAIVYIAALRTELSLEKQTGLSRRWKASQPDFQASLAAGHQASVEEVRKAKLLIAGAHHQLEAEGQS